MDISSRFFKLLLKIGNKSFSEVVAPVECEQPKDGNVVPPKEPDHHGNRSQEAAASTTKGKRNRKSNVEMECEQPEDGNVVPRKDLDQQGTKSEAAAASTTKGKRNRKSNVEKSLDVVFEKFKQASSEEFLR